MKRPIQPRHIGISFGTLQKLVEKKVWQRIQTTSPQTRMRHYQYMRYCPKKMTKYLWKVKLKSKIEAVEKRKPKCKNCKGPLVTSQCLQPLIKMWTVSLFLGIWRICVNKNISVYLINEFNFKLLI